MSPSPRGNDVISDQDNISYNFNQMPNHSPNEADRNVANGLDYEQQQTEDLQSPMNACQNDEIAKRNV